MCRNQEGKCRGVKIYYIFYVSWLSAGITTLTETYIKLSHILWEAQDFPYDLYKLWVYNLILIISYSNSHFPDLSESPRFLTSLSALHNLDLETAPSRWLLWCITHIKHVQ